MIRSIVSLLSPALAALGWLALVDPAAPLSAASVASAILIVALTVVISIAIDLHRQRRGTSASPTRAAELLAPLEQSDPDAAGHVRRRGPGRAAAAA